MGSDYERELKSILQADDGAMAKLQKQYDGDMQDNYLKIKDKPFLVVRAAGSLGVDLVAIRGDISFPIEVKSGAKAVMHFSDNSGRANEQALRMKQECERSGVIPVYAFRLKKVRNDDSWRIFTLDQCCITGSWSLLYDRLPKLERTPGGSFKMNWQEGMPLHKFIEYLCG